MKTLALTLFVLLFLSLIGNYLQWHYARLAQRDRNQEAEVFRSRVSAATNEIAIRDSATSTRIKALQKDSLRHAAVQGSLKTQIRAFRVKLQNLPPAVHDTLIFLQDSLISDLSAERDTIYLVNTAVVDSLQKSNFELKELFTGQLKESIRLSNELQREKKRRFSVGPHAGYGFKGPDLGVSIQYTLFRF